MNDSRHPDDDTPIPDDVADRILAEASKLDEESERTQLTVAQLRAAAVEAGISEEAFEAALEMVRDADRMGTRATTRWMSRLRRLVAWSGGVGGVIGLSWGALARALPVASPALLIAGCFAGVAASLHLAGRHRPGARVAEFITGMLLLWTYLFAGVVVATGVPVGALSTATGVIVAIAAGCLIAGIVIVLTPGAPGKGGGSAGLAPGEPRSR